MTNAPRPTLLVGSVNLADAREVFTTAVAHLGGSLRSLPDGETGDRTAWIGWQQSVLENAPFLRKSGGGSGDAYGGKVDGFVRYNAIGDLANARFEKLGYAEVAIESYSLFKELREQGGIPDGVRFQVSLPTPFAPLAAAIEPSDFLAVERVYEAAMRDEIERICAAVPAEDLAIQWDVSVEIAVLEGVAMTDGAQIFADPLDDFASRIARALDWIPAGATAGFHLCYGDYNHKHFVEPKDTSLMVEMANCILAKVLRKVDWVHMPVPLSRSDEAYFAPLADLQLPAKTQLYLGLVHRIDGLDGGRRRIDAAERYISGFGISTECGMGRRPPDTIPGLMGLMAKLARE